MAFDASERRGDVIFGGIFLFSIGTAITHFSLHQASFLAELLGQWALLIVALGFGGIGYRTLRKAESAAEREIIGVHAGIGYGLAGLASGVYAYHQHLTPEAQLKLIGILFQSTFVALVGGIAGLFAGFETVRRERIVANLEATTEELEASNDRLQQFAHIASHDLQEPLRMVSTYLRMIETRYSEVLDEEGQEFLDFAVGGADRMRKMIDGLLAYSRVETQGDPFETVDLETVVDSVLSDLQKKIEDSEATVTVDDLPRIEGERDQLRQVFQNLVENAIKYNEEGAPEIHIGADRDGDEWVVSVQDNGIGIDPSNQDRIFQMFQRLQGRDEHSGTGIGLALCEQIITHHGGDIWAESEDDEGTTFYFTLPAV